ncbi:hypothetical protein C0992_008450 [Termitomyces sp. T32_za158]|nr:hypothetical protein C0992_008450 [Termitomyces sp. T32_za158]
MEGFLNCGNDVFPAPVLHLRAMVIAPDTPMILLPSHSSQSLLLRTTITPSKETLNTLIDSGATDNFIDKAWAALTPGPRWRLPIPICLHLFNRNTSSVGDITYFVQLPITFTNRQQQELWLLVTICPTHPRTALASQYKPLDQLAESHPPLQPRHYATPLSCPIRSTHFPANPANPWGPQWRISNTLLATL